MDINKDYYAILGVLPSAEDVVIKAAYKALAQRYHPDKTELDRATAHHKMAEINEAYTVLKNHDTRKEYEEARGTGTQNGDTVFEDDPGTQSGAQAGPIDEQWSMATTFYPELKEIDERLSKISWRLALAFRAYLVDSREYENAPGVAKSFEREFLEVYFGSKDKIKALALQLIFSGNREATRALNKAVKMFGEKASEERIIAKIKALYNLEEHNNNTQDTKNIPDQLYLGSQRYILVDLFAKIKDYEVNNVVDAVKFRDIVGEYKHGKLYVAVDDSGNYIATTNKRSGGKAVPTGCLIVSVTLALLFLLLLVVF